MKKISIVLIAAITSIFATSCTSESERPASNTTTNTSEPAQTGQSGVQDDISQKNVVQVAVGSKDHSTLVAAVQQAELVDALSNAGPFTVFAPINAAFDKLPAGTVDDLMKDENKEKLADILQYHVFVGVLKEDMIQDGQSLGQVNGGNITISKSGSDILINKTAKVLATVPASNGIVYVIDGVLLPQ
ncbi:fasciclin domain-containing protein [Polluticoccus soli]|uniref:fasciclin domain-containing protein n=1 Tax=Polluticoccus soli TaxID=3034150 RepID=UPI0023E0FA3B|nr:fasciclin domain-containing protein [Flavipsychrobacter sp. JY13-12]